MRLTRKATTFMVMIVLLLLATAVTGCGGDSAEESGDSDFVVVYAAGPGGLAGRIAEGFEAATGIRVEQFDGTTGAILGRLEAERDNPIADVVVLASWPAGLGLYEEGLLMQYTGAPNADKLVSDWYSDGYLFGYSASALGITYNSNIFPQQPGNDWSSFTDPQFRGLVAMPDPGLSGSALDFLAGYISNNPDTGWELFEALQANEMEVAGANRPALDSVVNGSRGLVLAGVDYMAYADMARGEPLGIFYPASGTVINPRPAMILRTAKNPNNARAFIDYLLSDEAQQMVANAYIIPGRADIAVHPDRLGVSDIPQLQIDWNWMTANQEAINERFQGISR